MKINTRRLNVVKEKVPFDVIVKANKLGDTRFTGDTFEVVEVVSGEKCSNRREYGFTSIFMRTKVPGVYYWIRSTTSEYNCGPQYYVALTEQGYVVLTENQVKRILEASKRINDAAVEAWLKYRWGDGDYPRYTGDSCEAEIAAIIAENN